MQVRVVDPSVSDVKSANIMFNALLDFYNLDDAEALDMFARNGALTVQRYAYAVANLDLWELGPEHEAALKAFRPRDLKIGCSYMELNRCTRSYDFVVIDTPQGIHKDANGCERVEHFDVMRNLGKLLKPKAVVVLYVNRCPYNRDKVGDYGYDQYQEYDFANWMKARQEFYSCNPERLTEEVALNAYRGVLHSQRFSVKNVICVPCYSDVPERAPYAFRLALELQKF